MKTNINSIKGLFCGVLLTCGFAGHGVAEPTPAPTDKPAARADEGKFKWFDDGKFGIMVCWGIYCVNGIDESWSFFNNYLPYDQYMQQLKGFTAKNYDPAAMAGLIKQSGARYAVMTAKHHDGVALWDTKANDLSVPKATPAGKDVLKPFNDALRAEGLKVGMYYSLMDWSHADFPVKSREFSKKREKWIYRPEEDPARWDRFMDFNFVQYKELAEQHKPDFWWFDGQWWFSEKEWRSQATAELIRQSNPDTLINDRLPGLGDYMTPEQGIPLTNPHKRWEACMTINGSWGYQPTDKNYKSSYDVICLLADCIHLGGNLMLSIGPKEDGSVPEEQEKVLKEMGRWMSKHEKAVYGTRAGIDLAYYNGPSTIGDSNYLGQIKGGEILYLFLPHKPNGAVRLKGLMSRIKSAWIVGNGTRLTWRQDVDLAHPGILYLNVPEEAMDKDVTVLALLMDGPVKLQPLQYTPNAPAVIPAGANTGQ